MTSTPFTVYHSAQEFSAAASEVRAEGRRIALVPTMGALHAGHMELVRRAAALPQTWVAVSIFVNPLQFGPNEDFSAYPRTVEDDLATLATIPGVDAVFIPTAQDMYPHGFRTTINPSPLATELEGATRPGHFAGALTVCAKLFHLSHCTDAFFGEKDYQQLVLLRHMVTDLDMPLTLHPVAIQREDSGLALSSRNRYLSDGQHRCATQLSAALRAGQQAADNGASAAEVRDAVVDFLRQHPGIDVDYVEVRDTDLCPLEKNAQDCAARLLIAARIGTTRLIDNTAITLQ